MDYKIFSCSPQKVLASKIAECLFKPLGDAKLSTFKDGELSPHYNEVIRGHIVFIIGGTTQDTIMETLLMIDAAKRAASSEIVVVIPYYGYSRQDRKEGHRGPIGAKLVADLLTVAGANRIITVDLHAAQIQGFFNIPFDHISGHTIFTKYLIEHNYNEENNWIVCAPDAGGFQRASRIAEKLGLSMVAINKRRDKPNSIGSMELVGDVKGKNILIIDDIADTLNTLKKASELLKENGADIIAAAITHPILSGNALENLSNSHLFELIVSDTVPKIEKNAKIKIVSCASVIAQVIQKSVNKESISQVAG